MWPDAPYAEARGSFITPVEPPITNPDDLPRLTVSLNCDWLPYVRGALYQLLLQSTWKTDIVPLLTTQDRVFNLIGLFPECVGAEPPLACPYDFVHSGTGLPFGQDARGDLTSPWAQFIPTVGWNSVSSNEPSGGDYWQHVGIAAPLGQTVHVGIVQAEYANLVPGDNYGGNYHANGSGIVLWLGASAVAVYTVPSDSLVPGSGVFNHDFGGVAADKIGLYFLAGVSNTSPAAGNITLVDALFTGHAPTAMCP